VAVSCGTQNSLWSRKLEFKYGDGRSVEGRFKYNYYLQDHFKYTLASYILIISLLL
jgi:hypothetical protein